MSYFKHHDTWKIFRAKPGSVSRSKTSPRISKKVYKGLMLFFSFLYSSHLLTNTVIPPKSSYSKTISGFDSTFPGYGIDTAFQEYKLHYPMAYALFASAESKRYLISQESSALANSVAAVEWLVKHKELSGEVGWGLPFAWDAFGDGSLNKEHTVCGIVITVLVVQALLDVVDALERSPENTLIKIQTLIETAQSAIRSFLDNRFDRVGEHSVFWYSTNPDDSYHVLHATSMLVGQIQRLSNYVDSPQEAHELSLIAHQGFLYIIESARLDEEGNLQWLYEGKDWPDDRKKRPNDLVHEVYVIQGLTDYAKYGGADPNLINPIELYGSFTQFLGSNQVFEWPSTWKPEIQSRKELLGKPVRLWGASYAIHVAAILKICFNIRFELSQKFYCKSLNNYFTENGWRYKPDESDFNFIHGR